MEKSGFFNAMKVGDTWDRIYKAEYFAEYFATFIGNGVFPNPATGLQVVETDKMQVIIRPGKAWINGFIYINTDDLILNVDVADGALNRIDKVVLCYDVTKREIRALVKKGEFSSSPTAPEITRNADVYELALADIKINTGIIKITQADITDLRLNKSMCGIVNGTVEQVDTTAIFNQFQSWYSTTKENYDKDIATWTKEKKQAFDKWYNTNIQAFMDKFNRWYGDNTTQWTNDFNIWFESIKGQLNGDIAANLTTKTIELEKQLEYKVSKNDLDASKIILNSTKLKSRNVKNALEEVFTSGVNAKQDVVTALTSKDVKVTIKNTWEEISTSILEHCNKISAIEIEDYMIIAQYEKSINAIAIDIDDNICCGGGSGKIEKLSPDGKKIWEFNYGSCIKQILIDKNNNICCCGDTGVQKLTSNGKSIWKYNSSFTYAIAIDKNNNIYHSGVSGSVVKLSSSGEKIWEFNSQVVNNYINAIDIDKDDNIYCGGYGGKIEKLSPDGKKIWEFNYENTINSILTDKENIYCGGHYNGIKKIALNGKLIETCKKIDSVNIIKKDNNNNNLYFIGLYTMHINLNNKLTLNMPVNDTSIKAFTTDNEGHIYFSGYSKNIRKQRILIN